MEVTDSKQNLSLIESMFQAGAHFGYSRTRRHPSYEQFLFGSKDHVDIINLEKTGSQLAAALAFVKESVQAGKVILFVGTKPEARKVVEEMAISLGAPYVVHRWIGGTLTNLSEMRRRISRFEELEGKKERGELDVYTKKERLLLDREMDGLAKKFGGVISLKQLPYALFVVDPRHEYTAVNEAKKKNIPIIALAGTDCDMKDITYPIPANDGSLTSIRFFVAKLAEAYKEGVAAQKKEKTEADTASKDGKGDSAAKQSQ